LVMIYVPYPLRLDAKGQLLPAERNFIYPQRPGQVVQFLVNPGDVIRQGTPLVRMRDQDLAKELTEVRNQIASSTQIVQTLSSQANSRTLSAADKDRYYVQMRTEMSKLEANNKLLQEMMEINDAEEGGLFKVKAPRFQPTRAQKGVPLWTVLTADFNDQLTN